MSTTSVVITFANNTSVTLSVPLGDTSLSVNYLTGVKVKEAVNKAGSMPVGVVSANTLSITLNTSDLSLMPDNTSSAYYGYMDNSATVNVSVTDDSGTVSWCTFYVNKWQSAVSSTTPYKVIIEASDKMTSIGKNAVPDLLYSGNTNSKDFVKGILVKLNAVLPEKYRIKFSDNLLDFGKYLNVQQTYIKAQTMFDFFNTISQSLLSNIFISRGDYLISEPILDVNNNQGEPIYSISDINNVYSASLNQTSDVVYSKVDVNHLTYSIGADDVITSLSNVSIPSGVSTLSDLSFSSPVFKINSVMFGSNASSFVSVQSISYNAGRAQIVVNNSSDSSLVCDVVVRGQILKENKVLYSAVGGNSAGDTCTVTNSLVPVSQAQTYASDLLNVVAYNSSEITCIGYFNPRIQLCDIVNVDLSRSVRVSGRYKVTSLEWSLGTTISCVLKCKKVN